MSSLDDLMYSDLPGLEIDLSLPVENDIDRNIRLHSLLHDSMCGNDLYENLLERLLHQG